MIHVDLEKGHLEYEGNGEELLKDIVAVLLMSLKNLQDEHDMTADDIKGTAGLICKAIHETLTSVIDDMEEGDIEYEARNIPKERSGENISTEIKTFRRRGRRITS